MTPLTRLVVFLIFSCLTPVLLHGQTNTTISESLAVLSDSVMKSEIASFTQKGATLTKGDSLFKVSLHEIPVTQCSDKEVHLSWSTFTSSVSTFISLYFKGQGPDKMLDSIFLVTHSHFRVKFPGAAFNGIYQSNTCNFSGRGKKAKFFSPYYKACYSADKSRLYIYMLGGTNSDKYEVTWVIVKDKYYTRILDNVL